MPFLFLILKMVHKPTIFFSSMEVPSENATLTDKEDHFCHVFTLKSQDFGRVEQIDITVPQVLPKKCQVRIPQSNKKDYCRFRFNPITIKISPQSQGKN